MAMISCPDVWNDVDASHLDGDTAAKTAAVRMKEDLIRIQENRAIVKNEIYLGSPTVQEGLITTGRRLDVFCDEVLEQLEDCLKIVFLETWGDSDRWKQQRRIIDGDRFYQNEESCGVVGVCLRVRPVKRRPHHHPDLFSYIHIGKILENEKNNQPTLPVKFKAIFVHPNAVFVGENISRHIMRLENSFFARLDGIKYVGLTDLVDRFERAKRDVWDPFYIDPFGSEGILNNFHRVFPEQSFFKNPFECVANWDSTATMRESQLIYALTNVWASVAIFDEVIGFFEENKMQVAVMVTNYPRLVAHERSDDAHLKSRRGRIPPLAWYNEKEWPKGRMTRHPTCVFGSGDPTEIRRLQSAEREELYGSLPEDRRRLKKIRLDGAVGANDRVDEHRQNDEKEKAEREETTRFAKRVAPGLHSDMPDKDLAFALKVGKWDEVFLLLGLMEAVNNKSTLKRVLSFFAKRWPSDRKTRFIETLVTEDYFNRKREVPLVTALRDLNLAHPHPRIFLLFKTKDMAHAEYFKSLGDTSRREILVFLSQFLEAKVEDRLVTLRSCPFFRDDGVRKWVWEDK